MYLIGLTGGIAAGKSVVARRLAEHGAVHIDADALAREAVEPGTPALEQITAEFGADVLDENGRLNRAALGSIAFGDAERLATLNSIVHPAVKAATKRQMSDAAARDPEAIIVYDVPLLVEANVKHGYDLIVVVEADEATRMCRLVELRGMAAQDAAKRIRAQASDADRRAVADVIIDSDGSLENTLEQADAVWERVSRSAAGKH
jgi:dephospho-CoA kinase